VRHILKKSCAEHTLPPFTKPDGVQSSADVAVGPAIFRSACIDNCRIA